MTQTLRSSIKGALNRSIKGGLLKPAQFRGSTLDLDFAGTKSLKNQIGRKDVVTFTRASSATYVDGDGVIQSAVTNLLTYSEEFDNASWPKSNAAITANQAIAPDGTLTADKLEQTATAGNRYVYRGSLQSTAPAGQYVVSIFVKPVSPVEKFRLRVDAPGQANILFAYDFASEIKTQEFNCIGTVTSVGDGWYRMSSAFTADFDIANVVYDLHPYQDGSIGDFVYLWGAQLEQGTTLTDYIPTTSTINSAPRFDHDPATGESLGLLIEEARTNLVIESEDFTDVAVWAQNGDGLTRTANQVVSPDGTVNATLVEANAGSGNKQIQDFIGFSTIGVSYTASVFAKAGNWNYARVVLQGAGVSAVVVVDLSDGTLITSSNEDSYSIQPFGNGWYRISVTGTATAATGYAHRIGLTDSNGNTSGVPENSSIYIWGAQMEEGSFPTSYIPTDGSAVTRAADVAEITGTNFSSFYNQTEGTVFAKCTVIGDTGVNQFIYSITDGATGDEIRLFKTAVSDSISHGIQDSVNGTTSNLFGNTNSSFGQLFKTAHAFAANDVNRAVGGILSSADTSATLPVVNQIRIGQKINSTFFANLYLSRLTYWPERLPDATLQTITT